MPVLGEEPIPRDDVPAYSIALKVIYGHKTLTSTQTPPLFLANSAPLRCRHLN